MPLNEVVCVVLSLPLIFLKKLVKIMLTILTQNSDYTIQFIRGYL